ncbi:heme-binding protein [Rubneribacter sp.]|nr:heme-binding protein [Candidatus Rubneribacter avistercoris]
MENVQTAEELLREEKGLAFATFDERDAYNVGTLLYERGMADGCVFAVRVEFDGVVVFQALMPGTGQANCDWLDRKCATVRRTHHSSLYARVQAEEGGAREPWQGDEQAYALYGGAFPLVVDGEFRGVAAVSGMPHVEDHRYLVRTLSRFADARARAL